MARKQMVFLMGMLLAAPTSAETLPLVIAHRGASGYLPEHTLASKALAFGMGADYLEQDVVMTKDRHLIVLHDIQLDTVTDVAERFPGRQRADGRYYAIDFTLDEIQSLRVHERLDARTGQPVYPGRFPPQASYFRVPTLAEEIELVQGLNAARGSRVGIYPEIKQPAWHRQQGYDISKSLLALLQQYGYAGADDPVLVQCFDPAETRRLREELQTRLRLIQLIGDGDGADGGVDFDRLRTPEGLAEIAGYAQGIGPHVGHVYLGRRDGQPQLTALIPWAHHFGLQVHPYTLRRDALPPGVDRFSDVLDILRTAGADGLFTDFPDLCVAWRRQAMARDRRAEGPLAEKVAELAAAGRFAAAEQRLRRQLPRLDLPATTPAARQLEILQRTRLDFPWTAEQVLQQLQSSLPEATADEVERWRATGELQHRLIDGDYRFFDRAVSNLFRFSPAAAQRKKPAAAAEPPQFDLTAHLAQLVRLREASDSDLFSPLRHRVRYELRLREGHPRLKPGSIVRAWLPFPQEYRQQSDVQLLSCEPAGGRVAKPGAPQRTIYFEQVVTQASPAPHFAAEFSFITRAYAPQLDPARVMPYDAASELYRTYTAQRPPHIVFTAELRQLVREIVGQEQNALEKTRRIFRWVSDNVPWCAEREYSTIPNLSAKGLSARRGDCGVQGMTFITLCRAAGIPARWQSGWQTQPGRRNMHDWSEFYIEPWGWLPADASYGVRQHADPRVQYFLCGGMDPYRLIVNLDYARDLHPPKISFRSEPNDFQRGEVEIDGFNLYYDAWDWKCDVQSEVVTESGGGNR